MAGAKDADAAPARDIVAPDGVPIGAFSFVHPVFFGKGALPSAAPVDV